MAEVNPVTPEGQNGTQEGQNNNAAIELPKSAEELNAYLQRESDKRVTQALKTAKEKWEQDAGQALEQAKAEAAKLARMTQEEKTKFELEKRERALAEKEAELSKRDLKLTTIDILKDKQLPIDFVDYIMANDAETTKSNIDKFSVMWQQKLEEAVNQRLKGSTPKAGSTNSALTMDDIRKMSPTEINARWSEVQQIMNKK